MALYETPDTSASSEEREALSTLAPVRTTLERMLRRQLARGRTPPPAEPEIQAALAQHWTLILEAYKRGVRTVTRGLHRAEGLDHEMVDQALDFALIDQLGEDAERRRKR